MPGCIEVAQKAAKEVGWGGGSGQGKVDEGKVSRLTFRLVVLGEKGGEGADWLPGKGGDGGGQGGGGRGGRGGWRPLKLEEEGVKGG